MGVAIGSIAVATPAAQAKVNVDIKTLHDFGNAPKDGWQPWGSPTLAGGKLWGRTTYGGENNQGAVLWKIDPAKQNKYTIAHEFGGQAKYADGSTGPDVANPHHDLMRLRGNHLFGAGMLGTKGEGGLFRYNWRTGAYRVLHAFDGIATNNPNGSPTNGARPHSNPVPIDPPKSKSYELMGMTAEGGANGLGSLYRLRPDGTRFKLVHSFDQTGGNTPHGTVTQVGHRVFGMTRYGAVRASESAFPDEKAFEDYTYGNGVIFVYNLKRHRYRVLHEFGYTGPLSSGPGSNTADGAVPFHGNLTVHGKRLWGMTTLGGKHGGGVIFSIKSDGSGYRIEHTFDGPAGPGLSGPRGTLMTGPDNRLYGLTYYGGTYGNGGAFRFNPKTKAFVHLVSFGGSNQLANGVDDPVITANRRGTIVLYGMTKNGGTVQSNFLPTPIAPDWVSDQPAYANGAIWKAVVRESSRK